MTKETNVARAVALSDEWNAGTIKLMWRDSMMEVLRQGKDVAEAVAAANNVAESYIDLFLHDKALAQTVDEENEND